MPNFMHAVGIGPSRTDEWLPGGESCGPRIHGRSRPPEAFSAKCSPSGQMPTALNEESLDGSAYADGRTRHFGNTGHENGGVKVAEIRVTAFQREIAVEPVARHALCRRWRCHRSRSPHRRRLRDRDSTARHPVRHTISVVRQHLARRHRQRPGTGSLNPFQTVSFACPLPVVRLLGLTISAAPSSGDMRRCERPADLARLICCSARHA